MNTEKIQNVENNEERVNSHFSNLKNACLQNIKCHHDAFISNSCNTIKCLKTCLNVWTGIKHQGKCKILTIIIIYTYQYVYFDSYGPWSQKMYKTCTNIEYTRTCSVL